MSQLASTGTLSVPYVSNYQNIHSMNKCQNCNADILEDSMFCPHCGYNLAEPDTFYHYTSVDALNAILNNVAPTTAADDDPLGGYKIILRATHWMFLNDPLEYKYFLRRLKAYFDSDVELKMYKQVLDNSLVIQSIFTGRPYIVSFSKNQDNLDMWRGYAKNGTGVAIGFKRNELSNYRDFNESCQSRFFDCRYVDDNLSIELKKDRDRLIEIFSNTDIHSFSIEPFLLDAISYKHPAYIHEREVRVVLFDSSDPPADNQFRVSNATNIPFIDAHIPLSYVNEIIIGPCANPELVKTGIAMHLARFSRADEKIPILLSGLPYRQI